MSTNDKAVQNILDGTVKSGAPKVANLTDAQLDALQSADDRAGIQDAIAEARSGNSGADVPAGKAVAEESITVDAAALMEDDVPDGDANDTVDRVLALPLQAAENALTDLSDDELTEVAERTNRGGLRKSALNILFKHGVIDSI